LARSSRGIQTPFRRLHRHLLQAADHRYRRQAALEGGRVHEWLEGRPGLAAAAHGAVERGDGEVRAADHRQQVAGGRIDGDQRRLQGAAAAEAAQAVAHRGLGRILDLRHERRVDAPIRRVVAAVDVAELLAQVFLRVAVLRARDLRLRLDADTLRPARLFLGRSDLSFLAHPPQHDEAPLPRRIEMTPRGVRGRPADDAGDQRRFADGQLRCRLP
jgi:hypothetical protein